MVINTIRKHPQIIANFCELKGNFTGHCFRRSSANIIVENSAKAMQLQKFGRWKSATVAEGYVDQSKRQKLALAGLISHGKENILNGHGDTSCSSAILPNSTFHNYNISK